MGCCAQHAADLYALPREISHRAPLVWRAGHRERAICPFGNRGKEVALPHIACR